MRKAINPDNIYIKRIETGEDAAGDYRQYVNRYNRTCKSYRWVRQWRRAMAQYRTLETRVLIHIAKYFAKAGWENADVQTWLDTPNPGLPRKLTPRKAFNFTWIGDLEKRIELLLPLVDLNEADFPQVDGQGPAL